jgi:hypothetical protein
MPEALQQITLWLASLRDAMALPSSVRWYRSFLARPPANGWDAFGIIIGYDFPQTALAGRHAAASAENRCLFAVNSCTTARGSTTSPNSSVSTSSLPVSAKLITGVVFQMTIGGLSMRRFQRRPARGPIHPAAARCPAPP